MATSSASLPGLAPVASRDRAMLLDVVRGVTLYGVLLANAVAWFSGRGYLPKAEMLARTSLADEVALFFLTVFVSRKAQTLLTCWFGLGFALQLTRAESRGSSAVRLHLRRLGILFIVGTCHASLIWWGDVLWGYALTGGSLILFRRLRSRSLLIWASVLIFVPSVVMAFPAVGAYCERVLPGPPDAAAFDAELLRACRGNDYGHLVVMQAQRGFFYFWSHAPAYIPWLVGHFLIGYWAGRERVLETVAHHLPKWRRVARWAFAIGLAGGVVSAAKRVFMRYGGTLSTEWKVALVFPEDAANLAMAVAYVAFLALLVQDPAGSRRLAMLAPVGRMALTTYLAQSVIMTFLFYGWGLGLMLQVGPMGLVPLTLAVFGVQLVIARVWLRHFAFGPMEWVWRTLTYGRPPRPADGRVPR